MVEKLRRHAGIFIFLALGAILLFTPVVTPFFQKAAGIIALVWALGSIRIARGEEGKMKPLDQTDFFKKMKDKN